MSYKPNAPFITPLILMIPMYKTVKGVKQKTYTEADTFFCSFKTYGGTESVENDVLSVINTANIETWFRPDIKSDCRVKTEQGEEYEIIGRPENIDMRNQYLKFKIKLVAGGV